MKKIERLELLKVESVGTEVTVIGKISKIRKLGKIVFANIYDQTSACQILFISENKMEIQTGDFLEIKGKIYINNNRMEIHAENYHIIGESNIRTNKNEINVSKIKKLMGRSLAMQSVNSFMMKNYFLPVTSPTIVGDWVQGKTNTFEVDYYGVKKYLTLNSMLYHQIMLVSGYNKIYEFSKVFRKDNSSAKDRLSEFVSLEISMANSNSLEMMTFIEEMIFYIFKTMTQNTNLNLITDISFEKISYAELMKKSGCNGISGAQLSSKVREYMNNNYECFVWVYGFPEEKRRFFVKSIAGVCLDYQLWYKGEHQIASGGEREENIDIIKNKIKNEGKNIDNYSEFLRYFQNGVPPMCEIGFGFERFLLDITKEEKINEFVAFPRNKKFDF